MQGGQHAPDTDRRSGGGPGLIGDAQRSYHEGRFADGNSYLQAALLASDSDASSNAVRVRLDPDISDGLHSVWAISPNLQMGSSVGRFYPAAITI